MYKYEYKDSKGNDIYDTYGVVEGILQKSRKKVIMKSLYFNKYSIGLNEFWLENYPLEEWGKIIEDKERQLDITLNYILPLLKAGKLKLRIDTYIERQDPSNSNNTYFCYSPGKEYSSNESDQASKYIREKYSSIHNNRERESFISSGIKITLPENNF